MIVEDMKDPNRPEVGPNKVSTRVEALIHNLEDDVVLIVRIPPNPILKAGIGDGSALFNRDSQIVFTLEVTAGIAEVETSEITLNGVQVLRGNVSVRHFPQHIEVGEEQRKGVIGKVGYRLRAVGMGYYVGCEVMRGDPSVMG
jgi:hypothetical protein